MKDSVEQGNPGWAASVYYAESLVNCTLEKAWNLLLDYRTWNPTFTDAEVTTVSGSPGSEGEVVLIKKSISDVNGEPLPEFYAETVKIVPQRHIVWYVYLKEGLAVRNFVDFGISEMSTGVRFNVYYYAQDQLSRDLLMKQRKEYEAALQDLAVAFKNHCEANA